MSDLGDSAQPQAAEGAEGVAEPVAVPMEPAVPAEPAAEPAAAPAAPVAPAHPDWLQPFVTVGETPIAGPDPAGENMVREEPYEALEEEIKRPQAMDPEPTDWAKVEPLGVQLLATGTKDIKVAGYVAVALAEKRGVRGLASGAMLLERLLTTFGVELWPRRARGRDGALLFFAERVLAIAEEVEPRQADEPALLIAKERSATAYGVIKDVLQEDGKGFECLVTVRKWSEELARLHAAALKAGTAAQAPVAQAAVKKEASGGGLDFESADDVKRGDTELRKALKKAAALMVAADATNPTGYRMARFAVWPERLKFEVKDGITPVPSSALQDVEAALTRLEGLPGVEGVVAIEKAFRDVPWNLDYQRLLAQKLGTLGPTYEAAAGAVIGETLSLAKRIPGIEGYSFSNGVPFASPPTRAWLDGIQGDSGDGGGSGGGSDAVDEAVTEAARKAKEATAQGNLRGALEVYQRALAMAATPRAQFGLRLGLAKTCLENDHATLALPHLEELRLELASRKLGEWAPHLAVEVLSASVRTLRIVAKKKSSPEMNAKAAEALAELSWLDPLSALELDR